MTTHFKPKSARIGGHPAFAAGAIAATTSSTVVTLIPTPRRTCYVDQASIVLSVLGVSASSTIFAKLVILATDGSTSRDLTGTLSLESDGVATAKVPVDLAITANSGNRTLLPGETLNCSIASAGTNGTAPVGFITVEVLVQD